MMKKWRSLLLVFCLLAGMAMAEGAVHGVENGVENSVSSFGERIPSLQWIFVSHCGWNFNPIITMTI